MSASSHSKRSCGDSALDATLSAFFARTTHGIKPGLERIAALLERMAHPERDFAVIHVAGTNGKGSVCAMVESMLRAAGLRTGLYTSPHLVRFNERIQVAGTPIDDAALARLLREVEAHAAALDANPATTGATFFELATALAFEHFRAEKVQVAVVETGMGGRWDATNVVIPVVAVLTAIDLDHTDYLGRTIREIAQEKSGIIKRGRPVVCDIGHLEALECVRDAADAAGAPLTLARAEVSIRRTAQDWDGQRLQIETASGLRTPAILPLLGSHQITNAAVAVAAVQAFSEELGEAFSPSVYRRGLESVSWPARLQVLEREPPVLLDGAHNPNGAAALTRALDELRDGRPVALVCGVMGDKDAGGFFRALAPAIARTWTVPVHNARTCPPRELAAVATAVGLPAEAAPDLDSALVAAKAWATERGGLICIAGSLYLAGEVLARRQGLPPPLSCR